MGRASSVSHAQAAATARLGAAVLACLAAATPLLGQGESKAPEAGGAATLFERLCYSCHNIGGGDKTGPDLMEVTTRRDRDWLHRFIRSPKAMKRAGDPTAEELFSKYAPEQMADQMLSDDQIDEILGLIQELSDKKQVFIPESGKLSREPVAEDIPTGRRLFVGEVRLERGGPACITCHSVTGIGRLGGGTLGADLTNANLKYKDVELASILKLPGFPVMSKVYAEHELSDEEVVQLFALLRSVRGRAPEQARVAANYLACGVIGVVTLVCVTGVIWRNRLRGVRRQLTRSKQ